MERMKASDFPPGVMKLFDSYVHGWMSRRDFLDGAAKFAVGGMSAAAMLEALKPNYAYAQQIPPKDPRIKVEYVEYDSPKGSGKMRGYLAKPANAKGKLPGVIVIHENRGLNPYIEDVARRLAVEDFVAFAPDALTPVGGYPHDEEKAAKLYSGLDANKRVEDMLAAVPLLKSRPEFNGKYGATGFCAGGSMVNLMAVRLPDMSAGAPFYGTAPAAADVLKIKAAMLLHYAALDTRVNAGFPAFEEGLKKANVRYEAHFYADCEHGFHNDTTPRYVEAQARVAWRRTVAFFKENIRA